MKVLFAIFLIKFLDTVWTARPEEAEILEYDFQNDGTGPYYFRYLTSDGQSREERSEVEDAGTEQESLVVRGSYSYTGPDGIVYTVRYTADHNGFHPEGAHINVPPYIPWPKGHHQQQQDDDNGGAIHTRPGHVVQIIPPTQRPPPAIVQGDPVSPVYLPSTPKPPLPPQRPQLDVSYPTTQYLPSTHPPRLPPRPVTTTLPPPAADDPAHDPYYYTTPRPYLSSSLQPSTRRSYRHNQLLSGRITPAASDTVTTRTLPEVISKGAPVLPLMRLLQQEKEE